MRDLIGKGTVSGFNTIVYTNFFFFQNSTVKFRATDCCFSVMLTFKRKWTLGYCFFSTRRRKIITALEKEIKLTIFCEMIRMYTCRQHVKRNAGNVNYISDRFYPIQEVVQCKFVYTGFLTRKLISILLLIMWIKVSLIYWTKNIFTAAYGL